MQISENKKLIGEVLIAVTLVTAVLVLDANDWLWRWNWVMYDMAISMDGHPPPDDIVILEIDQRSLDILGRWPWQRRLHAEVVDILTEGNAKAIGIDILFIEPDLRDAESDKRLVQAVKASGRIVLPVASERTEATGHLLELLPFPELAAAAASLGHVDLELDADGQARQIFLKAGLQIPYWPHMALALAQLAEPEAQWLGNLRLLPRTTSSAGNPLAWTRAHVAGIPYIGPPGHFLRVSYADVLKGIVPKETFSGRIVLVGATATGLGESLSSPVSGHAEPMSGVEIVANTLHGLRTSRLIYPLSEPTQLIISTAIVLTMGLLIGWFSALRQRLLPMILIFFPIVAALILLLVGRRWFEPMSSFLVLAVSYPLWQWRDIGRLAASITTERRRAITTLKTLAEAVIVVDGAGKVQYLNPAAQQLTGWEEKEAIGQDCDNVFKADDEGQRAPFRFAVNCADISGLPRYWILTLKDGRESIVRASFACLSGSNCNQGMVITCSDVTSERRLSEQIRYQATHDSLTDLPNRMLLQDRLLQAMARARRSSCAVAILFTDIDDFKKINDSLGHAFGDQLLRTIAERLAENIRAIDTVARVGGDEFVIIIEQLADEGRAMSITEKLAQAVRERVILSGLEVFVTMSIGISFFPKNGNNLADLLKNADMAMYQAKAEGGDQVIAYKPELNERALNRFTLENDLQRASVNQDFYLQYQPIVNLSSGLIVGAEALVRWQHPSRGLLPPQEFISMAERIGLIVPIGEWVIQTACMDLARWQKNYKDNLRVAVNLSPRQLKDSQLPEFIWNTLRQNQLHPNVLELEITEEVFMSDASKAISVLHQLVDMGIQIAIDDFGTGYSSFSYLKNLPVTRLKIDRSFVRDIAANEDDSAIVKAIIAMARNLRLEITAEGVETAEQVTFLQKNGYIESQGFYFGKPVGVTEFQWLLNYTNSPHESYLTQ